MDPVLEQRSLAVDARVSATLSATAAAVTAAGSPAHEILDEIATASRGGKRLRSQLIAAAHDAYRGQSADSAIGIGAAVELFQTAALLHDDVLDDSDIRRGRPAAHKSLADLHRSHHWQGSADDFGAAAGILAGDLTLLAAHRALSESTRSLSHAAATSVRTLFADMAEIVTVGQYLDMRVAAQSHAEIGNQEDAIRTVMRTKTASYSAEFPLALGAASAGATADQIASMRDIGVPIGIAFQLRDDILGLTGEPEVTGKPAGDDVREGKRTMLVWHAWTHADKAGRESIGAALGKRDARAADVGEAVRVIRDTGAIEFVENEIRALTFQANERLTSLGLKPEAVALLRGLFAAATDRAA